MKRVLLALLSLTSPAWAQRSEEVHFARGAHSAHLVRGIPRGQFLTLFLSARKGQTMTVSVQSPEHNGVFHILKEDNPIGDSHNVHGAENWSGKLSWDGKYAIRLESTRGGAEVTVDIVIR
jgi:hypothetical protein